MDVGILSLLVSRFFMLVAILVAFKKRREIALENTLSAAVPWLAMVAMLIARWWTPRRAVERLHAGQAYRSDTSDPVFTNEIGERLSPQAATDGFRKIAVRAKASSTRLHDLRHTAGSHMLADGIDVKTASSVLGHASPTATLAIYGHVLEGGMRSATDRLGARFERIRDAG